MAENTRFSNIENIPYDLTTVEGVHIGRGDSFREKRNGNTTMATFEITIYNLQVREKVEAGDHHGRYADAWADFQYIEIEAANEEQARAQAEVMHPGVQGFVVESVHKVGGGFD